ncbi:xylosidase [Streptomyces sulfonofaciens]|uniref:Xylosidase n=1 Tax=Streptomyces sulfonofaciens TaxID=68272 RepID=A0A919KT68_9ACTN|nr:glycoside hydrolase 43 family protein [Streptomyces sulfonofaciens]GHH71634.1 xylosidase [Streptomyces sulfonofaciens]
MSPLPHPHSRRQVLKAATSVAAAGALPIPFTSQAAAPTAAGPRPGVRATFSNPVVWQDFADVDIIRVGDTYYLSASTMHYSPGAPILRSYNLVDWEFAGHSVPELDFGPAYDLNGGRAYVKGIWASSLNYRPSNRTFYWIGCIEFSKSYIYTASRVEGPWTRLTTIDNAYYDCGLLIDDDDTMYVSYGNTEISVAQLSADGKTQVRAQQVFTTPSSVGTLEGSRFYKVGGNYYIFLTRPANGQYILKSTGGPFGPYTMQQVLLDLPGPIPGGGVPHQGGLVETQNGDWYYMAFVDAYPGGRVPAMAPITWNSGGWPVLKTVDGAWGTSYPAPNLPARQVTPLVGVDTFDGTSLKPQWEWNHNPDTGRFSVSNGLTLHTATVTDDLYSARNTLTHRIQGPTSTATVVLDHAHMKDGDRAGLAVLRNSSAWIGIKREGGRARVCMVDGITMDSNWNTSGTGTEEAGAAVPGTRIWLRAHADIRPGSGRPVTFSYSTDGRTFSTLGPTFAMGNAWQFFMGHRYAVFNHATQALGGSVKVERFELSAP